MPALDIFSSSAFSMVALTDAINKMPYVPGRIGQLGLFREQGVSTTSVMIEEREGSLNLVETTARGAPAIQNTTNKRKARSLVVPHIALEDTILADEVQNVRAFGSESMLEGVQAVVNQRMFEMATKMDATLEHLRIGAIKGQILDADGSAVIYDLFTEFGVTAHTEIDFDLDNATPAPGVIKKKCHDIRRKIEDELGAQPYEHIHAICGADFFDDLITHPEVEKAYERYLDGAFLRQGQARGSFEYSGIVFEEYRGRVGTVDFTDASKAYFFPVGVPGLFRQYNAPADFVETANTIGLPRYAKQAVDQQFARWVMLHVQVQPAADLHAAARADQGQAHLMTMFAGAVDATFTAFGIDAVYAPAGGEPVPVRVIAKRPDTIVGFGETRIHAETATFEVRVSELASPRPGDQLAVDGETLVIQGEPERRDPDRLVWTVDVRPT
jgi:hypothetical protein